MILILSDDNDFSTTKVIEWLEYSKKEYKRINTQDDLVIEFFGEVLTKDKWEYWDEIVLIRLGDLYHGMELGCCLDIVKILNNNGTLDEAKEKIESQGHSGMSYGLVRAMVKEFSSRGTEFADYVR